MARIEIDETRWPIVYIKWPAEEVSDEEFKRALTILSAAVRKQQPFAQLHDARNSARPTPRQRAMASEHAKADAAISARFLRGSAIVVTNPLLVGVLTAMNWVFRPPFPQKTFSQMAEAEAWLREQLRG